MKIIPVLDIKDGKIVSAQQGMRDNYQPIDSKICDSSTLDDVIKGLLTIYSFTTFYIADLNAITNSGNNHHLIDTIVNQYQTIEFWIDNGTKLQNLPAKNNLNYRLVIGSECQEKTKSKKQYISLKKHILSLDFFPDKGYVGPAELIENSKNWPQDIIIMTLDRVGKNAGPGINKLKYFCHQYPEKNIIAAGGIRNEADLLTLKKIGVNHALIASALHLGNIKSETIKKLISIK